MMMMIILISMIIILLLIIATIFIIYHSDNCNFFFFKPTAVLDAADVVFFCRRCFCRCWFGGGSVPQEVRSGVRLQRGHVPKRVLPTPSVLQAAADHLQGGQRTLF